MPISSNLFNKAFNNRKSINEMSATSSSTSGYVGTYSMTVVNSKNNGKRCTFSKALSKKLGLRDSIAIAIAPDDGLVFLASKFPDDDEIYSLSGEDKKICYNTAIVKNITEAFKLDYDKKTSRSFGDITFETNNGIIIAAVKIAEPVLDSSGTPTQEDTEATEEE
jgi:hypothetical protein